MLPLNSHPCRLKGTLRLKSLFIILVVLGACLRLSHVVLHVKQKLVFRALQVLVEPTLNLHREWRRLRCHRASQKLIVVTFDAFLRYLVDYFEEEV